MQKTFSGLSGLGRNGRYAEMFRLQAQNYQDAKEIKLSHIEVPLEKQLQFLKSMESGFPCGRW